MKHTHSAAYDGLVIPLMCRPGRLIDIGANEGQYLKFILNTPNSEIVAFEPVVGTYLQLCANLLRFGKGRIPANISVFNVALGAAFGVTDITIPYFDGHAATQGASIIKDWKKAAADALIEVNLARQQTLVVPLDHYNFDDVTFLKIDVEGFELEVIRGAYDTLARCKPVIHIEIEEQHRARSTVEVPSILNSLNYQGFFFMDDRVCDFSEFDASTMQLPPPAAGSNCPYPDPYVFNFMFVHRDDVWALGRLGEIAARMFADRNAPSI